MKITSPDTRGWAKVKEAAKYAGVSVRTLRDWLKDGLHHIRMKTAQNKTRLILTRYDWIDEYLMGFEVNENQVDEIVKEVMREL
jgi:predicted site-specific integrase-resolvase